jgi:hypothetical protein
MDLHSGLDPLTDLRSDKIHRPLKNRSADGLRIIIQAMAPPSNAQKFVLYFEPRQFLVHLYGFVVWHVGVRRSMN